VSTTRLDVSDKVCPMTWLAAKLALEGMAPGEVLAVECAPGEARENVPRSAREAGHDVRVDGTTVTIVRR
jgi:tRNA 2-thiouridine synthesizing protein A